MICIDQLVELNGSVRNTALPTHHSHIYTITCVRVNDRVYQECMCWWWWWWSQFNIKILVLIFQAQIRSSALTHTCTHIQHTHNSNCRDCCGIYHIYCTNRMIGWAWHRNKQLHERLGIWGPCMRDAKCACDDNRIGNHIVVILLMLYDLLSLCLSASQYPDFLRFCFCKRCVHTAQEL